MLAAQPHLGVGRQDHPLAVLCDLRGVGLVRIEVHLERVDTLVLAEAARELRRAGAREVVGICVAATPPR